MVCYCCYSWCSCKHGDRRGGRRQILTNPTATTTAGLDSSILKALPSVVYSSKTHNQVLECAVCLSEFEEGENGRVLPSCNHIFHAACIDMWFHSHSNCPICRAPVQFAQTLVLTVIEPSATGSQPELQQKIEEEKGRYRYRYSGSSSSPMSSSSRCKMSFELVEIVVGGELPATTKPEFPIDLGPLGLSGSTLKLDSVPSLKQKEST